MITAEQARMNSEKVNERLNPTSKILEDICKSIGSDISEYLQAKFTQIGKDELMEAVGYISNRTIVVINDLLINRDNEWRKEMNRMIDAYEREMGRRLNVNRRDVKKSEKEG